MITTKQQQSGMSLVELMIAVTLSMVLVTGVVYVYASSKASFTAQREISTLQENQRSSVQLISSEIRKAGLSINKGISAFDLFDLTNPTTWEGGGSNPDEIWITYESDTNCLGANTDNPNLPAKYKGIAINRYYISDNQLMCQGNGRPFAQPIISGVVNMQVLYGEDTDPIVAGQVRTANRYVPASEANWANIVAVRIALLYETDEAMRGVSEIQERNFVLLDAPPITLSDAKRREVITTTITLRNAT